MSPTVHEVTMVNFESIVDTHPLVILDFWAAWCGPCRMFAPVFDAMAERHPDIYFGKVDTEKAVDLAAAFQIRSIPTLMLFKDGELVWENAGLLPPESLSRLLAEWSDRSEVQGNPSTDD